MRRIGLVRTGDRYAYPMSFASAGFDDLTWPQLWAGEVTDMGRCERTDEFHRLVWPLRSTVLRLAQFLSHNSADADDLAQEAMVKAFRSLDTLHDEARVKPWLMAILRHCHTDRLRAGRHKELSLDQTGEEPAGADVQEPPRPADLWHDPEETLGLFSDEEIVAALQELPKAIRWTLLLVGVEGLDDADAAEVLHVPTGTIKSRLHRGRAMLRTALAPAAARFRHTRPGGEIRRDMTDRRRRESPAPAQAGPLSPAFA